MLREPRYLPAGESALVVEFGAEIDPEIHDCVLGLEEAVHRANIAGITETVPTYRSLMIHFDPHRLTFEDLIGSIANLPHQPVPSAARRKQRWHIPVCYDPPYGEDLAEAAALLGLPQERVVSLHLGAIYRIYMYGFAPGYTFLGGLAQELTLPRRAAPRPPVPGGSLLIAGGQALIAGCAMPTGWYMIGRTPVKMFDLARTPVFLADVGERVCFERIDSHAFVALQSRAEAGDLVATAEFPREA